MDKAQCPIDYAATRRWLATRHVIGTETDYDLPDVLRGDLDADDGVSVDGDDAAREEDLEHASWDELFAEFERSQLAVPPAAPSAP